jgi:hypothetical protein
MRARIATEEWDVFEIRARDAKRAGRIRGKRRAGAACSAQAARQRSSVPVALRRRFVLRRSMVVRDELGCGGTAFAVRAHAYRDRSESTQRHQGEQSEDDEKFKLSYHRAES